MKPGIYALDAATYHADPVDADAPSLSASIAHLLCSATPLHAWTAHPRLNPNYVEDEDEKFDIGTAAHSILLEGVNVVEVLDFPDWRTKLAKAAREEVRAKGKVPLLAKVWADVEAMVNATRDQLDAHADGRHMFKNGTPEQVLVWQDIGGIWCRARLDWLRPHMTLTVSGKVEDLRALSCDDYKTTSASANPEVLSRTLFSNGWDVQEAFYRRGLKVLTGQDATFRFACQETYAPYALSVVALGPAAQTLAEKKVLFAMELWQQCLESNSWPAYPLQTCYATLPEYLENAWLAKEERSMAGAR